MYSTLIPVDEDENRALHQARYVASLADATTDVEATVLHVVSPGEVTRADTVAFEAVDAAVSAAEHLTAADVTVTRRVEDGSVPAAIVDTADELDSQEIVMGGRKRSGVANVLLGSTVHDVFVSTERPVTITGTGMVFGEGDRHVLVPVDKRRERALNQAEYVAQLPGVPESVTATVLYVYPHQDYAGAPPHDFGEIGAAVAAAEFLEERDVAVERVTVGGEVARKILATADDVDASSIVMGGRRRTGVQKVIMGSTAQDILLSSDRPVTITG
ncbi:universal stress protein [Haloarcula sp. JP-L23]|uniref:universal stress protein n=1 Tax=Haloarcula sp. JP-L23 TaxID=2716717 RepID=UPI00140F1128|nr:universal stress protein [Haloarcula sp. JP-L23]